MKLLAIILPLILIGGCAENSVLNPNYDLGRIKRIGVWRFEGATSSSGVEDLFNKNLILFGFNAVERSQVDSLLNEQQMGHSGSLEPSTIKKIGKLLGVDALILGTITNFTPQRKEVVHVPESRHIEEPIFRNVERRRPDGTVFNVQEQVGKKVRIERSMTPVVYTVSAEISIVAKLVDVETGEIIWVGSDSSEGTDVNSALDSSIHYLIKTLRKQWKLPSPQSH